SGRTVRRPLPIGSGERTEAWGLADNLSKQHVSSLKSSMQTGFLPAMHRIQLEPRRASQRFASGEKIGEPPREICIDVGAEICYNTRHERENNRSQSTGVCNWTNTMTRLSGQFGEDVARMVVYGGDVYQHRSTFELKSWREV
ncbi:MAG: hypothetical protein IKE55_02980, partial [Kiritimatiellae bacterium]|nr:hypothetical protein [Kiritimatiellia bacterium]